MTAVVARRRASRAGAIRLRPAKAADLPACATIWRDALNDYLGRLNQPPIPDELGPIARTHAHVLTTDAERFWVAERPGRGQDPDRRILGFVAATRRDDVWFLSMLFVRPGEQGAGLGRALLDRVLPSDDPVLATGTDSVQPISNALYAGYGIVPRMPLLRIVGRPEREDAFGPLPAGIAARPFESIAGGVAAELDRLDRELAGFVHPADHGFLALEGRRGFLYCGPDGTALGYGYTSEVGRVGPVAVRDESLVEPVLGHLLAAVVPRGASAAWVPGLADRAVVPLLRAGLRLDGFPILLCWNRPFADFRRYLPISPGLL